MTARRAGLVAGIVVGSWLAGIGLLYLSIMAGLGAEDFRDLLPDLRT